MRDPRISEISTWSWWQCHRSYRKSMSWWRSGILSIWLSERAWEAQQLSCNPKSWCINKNIFQSLATGFLWIISVCQHNSAFGNTIQHETGIISMFCLCFCLLLWKETPPLRSFESHRPRGDIWALLAGHADYINASVTRQMLQIKASCSTFLK